MAATRTALAAVPSTRSSAAHRSLRSVEAAAPTRPDLKVVPPRRPTGAIVAASLVVVFGVLLATAALNTMLVSGQRDLDRIERDIRDGARQNQALELEVAQLESPERIRDAAAAIGMIEPDEVIWLTPRAEGGTDSDVRATEQGDDATEQDGDIRADGGPDGSGG